MIYPFRKVVFDCKNATLLSIKKEEGKSTALERLKLWYHLQYCPPCRRFIEQWKMLAEARKKLDGAIFFKLSEEARQRINNNLSSL